MFPLCMVQPILIKAQISPIVHVTFYRDARFSHYTRTEIVLLALQLSHREFHIANVALKPSHHDRHIATDASHSAS